MSPTSSDDEFKPSSSQKKAKPTPKMTTKAKATTKTMTTTKAKAPRNTDDVSETSKKLNGTTAKPKSGARASKKHKNGDSDLTENNSDAAGGESGTEAALPMAILAKYEKLSQIEHILRRPDSYIGSLDNIEKEMWVMDGDKLVKKKINFNPGLFKIFDEILVNAADNKIRDPKMSKIEVTIDNENNTISILNNGACIPILYHEKYNCYVPELVLGQLLTSDNFQDGVKKLVGGRNGYGAKLCNIFSTEFQIETADATQKKKYTQLFSNNMFEREEPKLTEYKKGGEYTRVTFKPDLTRFGMAKINEDMLQLLRRRVFDLCATVKGVTVTLNGEKLQAAGFESVIKRYLESTYAEEDAIPNFEKNLIYKKFGDRWEIGIYPNPEADECRQVSFVNSISTSKGGTHVAHVLENVVSALLESIKKKSSKDVIKPQHVANNLWVFVNCLIENPAFDSQTKEFMTLPVGKFGSSVALDEAFKKRLKDSDLIPNIKRYLQAKDERQRNSALNFRKSNRINVEKLEDANLAGTKDSNRCTLILTEGDSAKGLAVAGLSSESRDYFGVFPLRGKLLNVRDASTAQILKNEELTNLCKILGLKVGKHYGDASSLRYGHVMIMTDQDTDGSHIKGLLINYLDHFYPSLLKVPGFLQSFVTPIVKATKRTNANNKIAFYTLQEYKNWQVTVDIKKYKIKYYKGLATSTKEEGKEYFSNLPKHVKSFKPIQDPERGFVDLAFNKARADDRKKWLGEFQLGTFIDYAFKDIKYDDFINKELIQYSVDDCVRSIPSSMDGFKQGQRKILFGTLKKGLKEEIKVAQLIGYIAENSAYHHGEMSLAGTIINMAQDFVGSNNINLLTPNGIFGSRAAGGKDAGSPRYIYTNLNHITKLIYHPDDGTLLNYLDDDGQQIEPQWYIPVIPMVLVNGAEGIGTGWSTSIPCFDPKAIIMNLRRMMNGDEFEEMFPWYRHFEGTIEKKDGKFVSTGCIKQLDDTTIEITELPIQIWTNNYKKFLDTLRPPEKSKSKDKVPEKIRRDFTIEDVFEYHTDAKVYFKVVVTEANMKKILNLGLEKAFKLHSNLNTTNIVCFNSNNRIQRYDSPLEILREFYWVRLDLYAKRKAYLLQKLDALITKLRYQVKFLNQTINKELDITNKADSVVLETLQNEGYPMLNSKADTAAANPNPDEDDDSNSNTDMSGYNYLLNMPIRSITKSKVIKLDKQLEDKELELEIVSSKSEKDMWNEDLDKISDAFDQILDNDSTVKAREAKDVIVNQSKAVKPKAKRAPQQLVKETDPLEVETKSLPKAAPKARAKPTINPNGSSSKPVAEVVVLSEEDEDLIPKAKTLVERIALKRQRATASNPTSSCDQKITSFFTKVDKQATPIEGSPEVKLESKASGAVKVEPKKIQLKSKTSTATKPKGAGRRIAKTILSSSEDEDVVDLQNSSNEGSGSEVPKSLPVRPKRTRKQVSYTINQLESEDSGDEEDVYEEEEDESFMM